MYVKTKEARAHYNVSNDTLRRWCKAGKIRTIRTKGNHRRYFIPDENDNKRNIIYARVSSTKQKSDLENQIRYLQRLYPSHELITDIGSGINFKRKGLQTILDELFKRNINEVVVASKDRLTRFGFEMFENIFNQFGSKIKNINSCKIKYEEQELANDLLSIVTVFTAKYHGRRSYNYKKNKNLSK